MSYFQRGKIGPGKNATDQVIICNPTRLNKNSLLKCYHPLHSLLAVK